MKLKNKQTGKYLTVLSNGIITWTSAGSVFTTEELNEYRNYFSKSNLLVAE
ncbi:hypothetical protein [Peribacillus loiseleuriae]|uniref:hypothetical protein n=1 Tax=Peribacillus loiseleuriae TaxID=1679170 RepID=UPI000AB31F05|nr:hypothetical protein [Peribacillus loiseleuriae]